MQTQKKTGKFNQNRMEKSYFPIIFLKYVLYPAIYFFFFGLEYLKIFFYVKNTRLLKMFRIELSKIFRIDKFFL